MLPGNARKRIPSQHFRLHLDFPKRHAIEALPSVMLGTGGFLFRVCWVIIGLVLWLLAASVLSMLIGNAWKRPPSTHPINQAFEATVAVVLCPAGSCCGVFWVSFGATVGVVLCPAGS